MSAKPSTPFVWATDAAWSPGPNPWNAQPNKVAPVSGLIAEGWEPTDHPTADNLNWILNLIGQWSAYLSDGALAGPHTLDGHLTINPTSPPAFAALRVHNSLQVVTGNLTVSAGDATIGDDLTVGGDVIATGDLRYSLQHSRHLNAAAARAGAGITWDDALSRWNLFTSTNLVTFPIDLAVGDRIHSWMVFAQKTSVTGTLSAYLARQSLTTGLFTAIGATQTNSAANPGHVTLGQLVTEDAPGDSAYVIVVQGGGSAGDYVKGVEINVTRP